MGCNGAVQILLEKLERPNRLSPLNLFSQSLKNNQQVAIATVFAIEGKIDLKIGSRLLIYPDDTIYTDIHEQELRKTIAFDTITAKNNRQSTVNQYQLPSAKVEVFIEAIQPPPSLIIFGAGRDALPIVELGKAIGWQVTIVDCRAQAATYQRFAIADKIILTRREIVSQQISVNENTVAVVMTHNYYDDLDILKYLIPTSIPYLGVMGAKDRITKILAEIKPNPTQLAKLYSPIGLDIGADTPTEIASAIIAEIQAVLNKRKAGFSKHRSQPLHERYDVKQKQVLQPEKVLKVEPK